MLKSHHKHDCLARFYDQWMCTLECLHMCSVYQHTYHQPFVQIVPASANPYTPGIHYSQYSNVTSFLSKTVKHASCDVHLGVCICKY